MRRSTSTSPQPTRALRRGPARPRSDTTYGTQVVFTNSLQAVAAACNSACLGVAYVGTFDNVDPVGYYQPAWVFTKTTMSTIIAAQGASHEAGHTLGLHHDGTSSASYYAGTSAWGPIMGSARHRAISQFSLGEYAGANNTEDDFAVIKANGLPTRVDDHGSTVADGGRARRAVVVRRERRPQHPLGPGRLRHRREVPHRPDRDRQGHRSPDRRRT